MLLERRGTDGTRANNSDLRVGIMGLGVVGSAVKGHFEAQGHRPRLENWLRPPAYIFVATAGNVSTDVG
jgi:hypothetical protein